MELLQLKYFRDAAYTQNFSETAKKHLVPPSDISQTVKRLEKELGVELFDRKANRITLNKNGEYFLQAVEKALNVLDSAYLSLQREGMTGTLRICIRTNRRSVMEATKRFRVLYPQVTLVTKCGADYLSEDFDLIITNESPNNHSFHAQRLLSEEILLAMSKHHPLAVKETITGSDLEEQHFIVMNENNSLYQMTYDYCTTYGFRPRIAIQSDDPFYIRKCIELDLGIAFVPSFSWSGQFSDDIVLKSVGIPWRDTYLLIKKDRHQTPSVEEFQKLLLEQFGINESETDYFVRKKQKNEKSS